MINDAKNKIISTHGCIKIDATDRTGEEQCCIFLPDGSRALVFFFFFFFFVGMPNNWAFYLP